jgi:RES domain-containing protein
MASSHKLTVWRIVTHRFASTAFSGEGAKLYGGRWNKKGVPMIYTSATQSLAMLEMLVQDEPLRANYIIIPAHIPTQIEITQISNKKLSNESEELRNIGSEWIRQSTTAILAVPSAVIPSETNYLLNPTHPDFKKIIIGKALPFITDSRLLKKNAYPEE